nr:YciI family protein [Lysinibacillus timonensis]
MQFLINAFDGTDDKAIERRLAAREEHLKSVEQRAAAGEHLYATAILNDDGKMIGSMMVVEYPSKKELDNWLKVEPYILGNVWEQVQIHPCSVPSIFKKTN